MWYPLSKAIEDGYTRTSFAVTRPTSIYNFGDEQLDKMMLLDGIITKAIRKLEVYAAITANTVKPFMPVCKDRPRSVGGKFHQIR